MVIFADIDWVLLPLTQKEKATTLCGVRAEKFGVTMEVRLLSKSPDGAHVLWTVNSHDRFFRAAGQIPLTQGVNATEAFNEGKRGVVKMAEVLYNLALTMKN